MGKAMGLGLVANFALNEILLIFEIFHLIFNHRGTLAIFVRLTGDPTELMAVIVVMSLTIGTRKVKSFF